MAATKQKYSGVVGTMRRRRFEYTGIHEPVTQRAVNYILFIAGELRGNNGTPIQFFEHRRKSWIAAIDAVSGQQAYAVRMQFIESLFDRSQAVIHIRQSFTRMHRAHGSES